MTKDYFNQKITIDGFVKIFVPELKCLDNENNIYYSKLSRSS